MAPGHDSWRMAQRRDFSERARLRRRSKISLEYSLVFSLLVLLGGVIVLSIEAALVYGGALR